jgi:tetratricopeptide (TPR) repeat protein
VVSRFERLWNAHQLLNNFTAALQRYDQAQVGRTLLAKVGLLFYLSRFDELFECARVAQGLFEDQSDEAALARLRVNLGNAYQRLDRYHEALDCYEKAFPVLERLDDSEGLLASSLNAAVVLTILHQFDRADEKYNRASDLARGLGMDAIELQSRYNRTYLSYLKGDSGVALRGMLALKNEFEQKGDDNHVCLCWLDEAEMLLELGDLPESIQSAREARRLGKKLGLNYEIGKSLLFEAAASLRTGQETHAQGLLTDAMKRFESEGNSVWTAVSQLQAALFRGEQGQIQALREATSARQLLESSALPDRLALADIVIGRIQRVTGNASCAVDSFESAVRLAQESNSDWMQ